MAPTQTLTDYPALADVLFDAVRNGPSLYTEAQRAAWVPERRWPPASFASDRLRSRDAEWEARLARQVIAVARNADRITGFMSIEPGGYIDFAYIRPEAQRTGLFRRLFGQVEDYARGQGEKRLWVHASLMAEPAFAAVGFAVIERECVDMNGESLARAKMEKRFSVA